MNPYYLTCKNIKEFISSKEEIAMTLQPTTAQPTTAKATEIW